MDMILVTNNPMVNTKFDGRYQVHFSDQEVQEVLVAVRDLVHRGHRLCTHPLSGNLRPWETPYKTVAVGAAAGGADESDVQCIEDAVGYCNRKQACWDTLKAPCRLDYQRMDLWLMESAL